MNTLKKFYKLLMPVLPVISFALTFLIIKPSGIIGYGISLLVGFTVYFFLWLIIGQIIPSYIKTSGRK